MADEKTTKRQDKALWRYGIISALLHRNAQGRSQAELLAQMAQQTYVAPDGSYLRLSQDTLRKWLYRYRNGGLSALEDQVRGDAGQHHVPEPIKEHMRQLRDRYPHWTLARVLRTLQHKHLWNGRHPSRTTLYRFAHQNRLCRATCTPHDKVPRSFAFDAFGQLWLADFMHGPKLRIGKQKRKTYLHAIIDDCSRYLLAARFYLQETVEVLITEMQRAVACFGIPQRFYTDNGPCYASRHLKIVCARLGVHLVHTPPYRPQGRGKVEPLFGTVRAQLLADMRFKSLDELNHALNAWVAAYHQTPHGSLNVPPLEQRLKADNVCRPIPEVANIEDLFRMQRRCRVYGDGTIRIKKRIFEVPGCLPGSRTTVYFLPWDLSQVYFGDDMQPAIPLDLLDNARRFDHPRA